MTRKIEDAPSDWFRAGYDVDDSYKCARTRCNARITDETGYQHKHLPAKYCRACAVLINDACPGHEPFDLTATEKS